MLNVYKPEGCYYTEAVRYHRTSLLLCISDPKLWLTHGQRANPPFKMLRYFSFTFILTSKCRKHWWSSAGLSSFSFSAGSKIREGEGVGKCCLRPLLRNLSSLPYTPPAIRIAMEKKCRYNRFQTSRHPKQEAKTKPVKMFEKSNQFNVSEWLFIHIWPRQREKTNRSFGSALLPIICYLDHCSPSSASPKCNARSLKLCQP